MEQPGEHLRRVPFTGCWSQRSRRFPAPTPLPVPFSFTLFSSEPQAPAHRLYLCRPRALECHPLACRAPYPYTLGQASLPSCYQLMQIMLICSLLSLKRGALMKRLGQRPGLTRLWNNPGSALTSCVGYILNKGLVMGCSHLLLSAAKKFPCPLTPLSLWGGIYSKEITEEEEGNHTDMYLVNIRSK